MRKRALVHEAVFGKFYSDRATARQREVAQRIRAAQGEMKGVKFMNKIKIGIVGYGNIGRGVELAIERNEDMKLVAVVTRRNPEDVKVLTEDVKKVHLDDILS